MCNPILQASLSLLKNFAMELLLQSSFTEIVEEFCKMELLQASFTELIVKGFCNHLEICFTEL
jgi:hypothetical protein